jgi:hypothetical protein
LTALANDVFEGLGMEHGRTVGFDDDVAGLDASVSGRAAGLDFGYLKDQLRDGTQSSPA